MIGTVLQNLTQFNAQHKFKQHVLNVMSDMMTESEVADLQKTFRGIDANGDGLISVAELKAAFDKSVPASTPSAPQLCCVVLCCVAPPLISTVKRVLCCAVLCCGVLCCGVLWCA